MAGAGNCEVATFGGGECRCDSGTGVSAGVAVRGWECEIAWRAAECVYSDETSRFTFEGSLKRNARFGDFTRDFYSKSPTKCCLERNACFGDLTRDFWKKSRTKRSFCRLGVRFGGSLARNTFCELANCCTGSSFWEATL